MKNLYQWEKDYELYLNENLYHTLINTDLLDYPYEKGLLDGWNRIPYKGWTFEHIGNRKAYAIGYCDGIGHTPNSLNEV